VEQLSRVIIEKLETIAGVPDQDAISRKSKAVSALVPYAVCLAQSGQQGMMNAVFLVASRSTFGGFMWRWTIAPYITFLFDEPSPPSLNQAITLLSPYANWLHGSYTQDSVARWAAAALATPYSEAVGQSVVEALLQISGNGFLLPHVPIEIWAWLKRRPSLPPDCWGRSCGTSSEAVRHIRGLGDIELIKSYFLLVWSEWDSLHSCTEMEIIIREEFCGIAMRHHRDDLTKLLDHVLARLNLGWGYLVQHNPRITGIKITWAKEEYGRLREALAEIDRSSTEALPGAHSTLIPSNEYTNYRECV
jgi:hypothetical protein